MKQTSERALNYFTNEYNCAQSVLMAFAPQLGLDLQTAARIATPFGAGIGRLGMTCGAVSGALMVIGLKCGHRSWLDTEVKERTYEIAREFLSRFEERHQSHICRQLLGVDARNAEEWALAKEEGLFEDRCTTFVRDAADIVSELLAID